MVVSTSDSSFSKKIARQSLTVAEANDLQEKVSKANICPGDTWHLVSHKWWVRFLEFKDTVTNDIEMPPISNESLMELKDGEYSLKPHLVEGLNFTLLPEEVFNKLYMAYGVKNMDRDIVKRVVVPGTLLNSVPFVELYLRELKIANFATRNDVITIKISYGETVDRVRERIMEALCINTEGRMKARFITEEIGGKFEPLPSSISHMKLSSLLTSGATIYVDLTGNAALEEINGSKRSSIYLRGSQIQMGVCGLQNLGNTCFMNSALQCLSNLSDLTNYFQSGLYIRELNTTNPLGTTGELAKAYAELIGHMWSGENSSVRPVRLKTVIGQFAPRFNGYAQQDSQELTAFVLDGLHEDLNRIRKKPYIEEKEGDGRPDTFVAKEAWEDHKKRNDSIIVDLMHGQLKSTLICPVCEKVSIKFDPFCFLSLPVPAKERQAKSTIVLVRSQQKWAKFVLTHTTKTTVAQALKAIRETLQIAQETNIVLIPSPSQYSGNYIDVLSDDSTLVPTPFVSYYQRNFFAFVIGKEPLMIIENKILPNHPSSMVSYCSEKQAGACPIVVTAPSHIDMNFILKNVLHSIKSLLFLQQDGSAEEVCDKLPEVVELHFNGKTTAITKDDAPIQLEKSYTTPRLVLKWQQSHQSLFKNVQIESLVEREVSVQSAQKRYFSLLESIDCFTTQEQLDENDTWYCPRCKEHRRAFKKLELWKLPKILICHLKRFQYTRYAREKIDTEVQVPTRDLNLSEKVLDPDQKNNLTYDLIGISNHSGGLGGGHYTAKALNSSVGWCEFNDSYAAKLDHDLPDILASREAYLLFYHRRDISPAHVSQRKTRSSAFNLTPSKNSSENSPSSQTSPSNRRISESLSHKMDIE